MYVKHVLGERNKLMYRAEIHKDIEGTYSIRYFSEAQEIKRETFEGKSIHYVEDAADNWISGIKTLNGQ